MTDGPQRDAALCALITAAAVCIDAAPAPLSLQTHGVCVLDRALPGPVAEAQRAWHETCRSFPEFDAAKRPPQRPWVMGGFGAYGHVSSFHNVLVRTLRCTATHRLATLLLAADPEGGGQGWGMEVLMDRMCDRPPGVAPQVCTAPTGRRGGSAPWEAHRALCETQAILGPDGHGGRGNYRVPTHTTPPVLAQSTH